MTEHRFIAFALAGELDLNKLGPQFGSTRKYRWEEPMLLNPQTFQLLSDDRSAPQQVYLYHFGGIVFLDCPDETIRSFSKEMFKITESFAAFPNLKFQESYALRVEEETPYAVTNDYALLPNYDKTFVDIIAFVIAKSVALERIEEQVILVVDEMEAVIGLLEAGKLSIPDKRLAKLASRILDFKYRSVASVMVLDKPEITWDNAEADRLYLTMANMFELGQRYQEIKHKSETLMDITDVFSGLSHASRSSRLEWTIIILILVEIFISLWQLK
jgi:uncharacterized Rmd1/YagE family protein